MVFLDYQLFLFIRYNEIGYLGAEKLAENLKEMK